MKEDLDFCSNLIQNCDALFIGAGAGMGVDSGLPDFRGKEGFWRAYPPLAKMGLGFEEMANPIWFRENPKLAWGFYGHRCKLYLNTKPHIGYYIIKKWTEQFSLPSFVFTSNVDGHFAQVGWANQLIECHGSLMQLQCIQNCGQPIWEFKKNYAKKLEISMESLTCTSPLPTCPSCGSIARPNILMFSDFYWNPSNYLKQEKKLSWWLEKHANAKLLIFEFGAGLGVPTVRSFCEKIQQKYGCSMFRFNPRDSEAPKSVKTIPMKAKDALLLLNQKIQRI